MNKETCSPAEGEKKTTQAAILLRIAEGLTLFSTPQGECYCSMEVEGHYENHLIQSEATRRWLTIRFTRSEGRPPQKMALDGAITSLESQATFGSEVHEIQFRFAEHSGSVYVDLGDPAWRCVQITASGWDVIAQPPVKFRRPRGMLPLPIPLKGGSIDDLLPFVNLDDEGWVLFKGWLVGAMRWKGPYPILEVQGEQGAAKSTLSKIVKRIVDPNTSPIRSKPKDERDLVISARNGWVLAYDNLSEVQEWLSDALCRLSTGGGFGTRRLYQDDEEVLINVQRPVVLNGIEPLATRSDLLDRAVRLHLRPLTPQQRMDEDTFWKKFDAKLPSILAGLFDAVSAGLRNWDTVTLEKKPRMADFARWVTAAEPALGVPDRRFMQVYSQANDQAHELVIEHSSVGVFIRDLIEREGSWKGTPTALWERMRDDTAYGSQVPRAPNQMSNQLARLAPNLRAIGIEVTQGLREGHEGRRLIVIQKKAGSSAPPASAA